MSGESLGHVACHALEALPYPEGFFTVRKKPEVVLHGKSRRKARLADGAFSRGERSPWDRDEERGTCDTIHAGDNNTILRVPPYFLTSPRAPRAMRERPCAKPRAPPRSPCASLASRALLPPDEKDFIISSLFSLAWVGDGRGRRRCLKRVRCRRAARCASS